jgi:hypothetical protein
MSDGERGKWAAAVDARLVARCEAYTTRGERMVHDWSVPLTLRAPKMHLEPADWRAGFLRADREREVPMQLSNDLRENMPQSLLRDLFRPEWQEHFIEREIVEGTADRGGFKAMREAREARRAPPLPRIESALRAVREHQAWRRALVAERWRPVKDEPAK